MGFSLGLERGIMSIVSGTYENVKSRFEGSAQAGFSRIDLFIVSPAFFDQYVKDPDKKAGRVIRLKPVQDQYQHVDMIEEGLKGYPTIISEGFDEEFAFATILISKDADQQIQNLLQ